MPGPRRPWSVIATIPWHQPLITMLKIINRMWANDKVCFASILLLAAGAIAAPVLTSKTIQVQLAKQCAEHDWPAEQHQAHVDYCHALGHEVGKLGPAF